MNCPIDNTVLEMSTREGIEIDYCPQCRGVWLDRGELDKLIEQSARYFGQQSTSSRSSVPTINHSDFQNNHSSSGHSSKHYNDDYRREGGHHKKRESWLGDLLDF